MRDLEQAAQGFERLLNKGAKTFTIPHYKIGCGENAKDLADSVKEILSQAGLKPEECLFRVIRSDKAEKCARDGTDRDARSAFWHPQDVCGWSPNKVTYATPLNKFLGDEFSMPATGHASGKDRGFVIWKKSGLYHSPTTSHGLYAFMDDPKRSIVAVFSKHGSIPLPHGAGMNKGAEPPLDHSPQKSRRWSWVWDWAI